MKKLVLFILPLVLFSCSQSDIIEIDQQSADEFSTRKCASHDIYELQLAESPEFAENTEKIERFIQSKIASNRTLLPGGIIEIPVVFNVLYNSAIEDVSDAQLQSQIDVLNADFGATNSDYSSIPSIFTSVASGNTNIRFTLAGVVRKATSKKSFRTDDSMKKSARGGIDPTSPSNTLNIWVCDLGSQLLGYAQFPGGAAATDGVVINYTATGSTGTAQAPFGLGRTATHEVGHWLNLRHIWGDATCGNDLVSDTPTHNTSNGGCPAYPHLSSCSGTPVEMTMNYMDYTYDQCMYMFSAGQKVRMQALFAAGGPRAGFAQ